MLINPSVEQFREAQQAVQPNLLYLQGQQLENAEIGSLVWGDTDLSDPQTFSSLISPPFPTIVYLEVPVGEKFAQSLHSKVSLIKVFTSFQEVGSYSTFVRVSLETS